MSVTFILFFILAFLGGLTQGVCGFGLGTILMLMLPYLFPITEAAAFCGVLCLVHTCLMAYRYRKSIPMKRVVFPTIFFVLISSLCVYYSTTADPTIMKRFLGGVFIVLCLYHFFFSKNKPKKEWSFPVKAIAIILSGICSGCFSLGGPFIVLYFLSQTDDKKEYLGCTTFLFAVNNICNTSFRIYNGTLQASQLSYLLIGILLVCIGLFAANKIVDKINTKTLTTIVYIAVGISGIANLLF